MWLFHQRLTRTTGWRRGVGCPTLLHWLLEETEGNCEGSLSSVKGYIVAQFVIGRSQWQFPSASTWAPTKSSLPLVRVGWARFIAPAIRASAESSPSRFSPTMLPIVPDCESASTAKHGRRQPESSAHLHSLRHRTSRRNRLSGNGVSRRGNAGRATEERAASA